MDFPIKLDSFQSGCSLAYNEGVIVVNFHISLNKRSMQSIVLAISAYSNERLRSVAWADPEGGNRGSGPPPPPRNITKIYRIS